MNKNPIKIMLIIVIVLLLLSIAFNIYQARKAKGCTCVEELPMEKTAETEDQQ